MKETSKNLHFKHFDQNQPMLLPPSLEELEPNHPVRVVSSVIDQINIDICSSNTNQEAHRFITHGCYSK